MGKQRIAAYAAAVGGVALATVAFAPFRERLSPTTVALTLVLLVLFVATAGGIRPATLASVLALLAFNFFFLPPYHTLHVEDPQNWVALAAFLVTAVTAGQLSARARRRAQEAERARGEVERLYTKLQQAFERASRAEALRQSEQMKSALLDAVTHDLRTPLTSIKVSVTTLLDELREPDERDEEDEVVALAAPARRELLEVIDEESDRLDRFVGNMVELARIEAGQMRLRTGWTSIAEVVDQALARAGRHARTHRVVATVDDDVPAIHADGRALAEVVYTLVDNAAKYSPAGTTIRVAARRAGVAGTGGEIGAGGEENETRGARAANADGVLVTIEDEGRGIPESLRERVFEKFFRFTPEDPNTSSDGPSGTGMGLAIARGIVEAHGGRIWIGDRPNASGVRVSLALPIGRDVAAEDALTEIVAADAPPAA